MFAKPRNPQHIPKHQMCSQVLYAGYTPQGIKPSDRPTVCPSDCPPIRPSVHPTVQPSDRRSVRPSDHPTVRPSDHPTVPPSIDFPCLHRSLQLYADLYVRYTPPHAVYDLYAAIRYLYADIRRAIRNLYAHIRYTQLYVRRPSILASPQVP